MASPEAVEHRLTTDAAAAGQRLDAWLARRLPDLSRSRLQALIEAGEVRLDGKAVAVSARLRAGQDVHVRVPPPAPAAPEAQDIPLEVVYEDERLLVVDKPAGLVVHPGAGTPDRTLVNALLSRVRDLSGVGGVARPGIVHRLDKGTSGLLVVAKDDLAHRTLVEQFAAREVEKEYLAIVLGVPARRDGTVEAPIGRDPVHRQRMSVRAPRGRPARTDWKVEEAFAGAALLRVRIHTGRTHQIRVHLASIGHPVAGDPVYGGTRGPAAGGPLAALTRPALHAARLAFRHPGTGARLEFTAPLPADLTTVLAALRDARSRGR
jgi:23S rRNA pseudouridine1911/1915/1917 synthase